MYVSTIPILDRISQKRSLLVTEKLGILAWDKDEEELKTFGVMNNGRELPLCMKRDRDLWGKGWLKFYYANILPDLRF